MSYSNAIFYMDNESGSDATRTTISSVTVANPSGSITRCTKTAHGLTTGAVVTLSNFSSWLNGAWKITKVDNDNFDLDTAVWQATADATGDVVPFGGTITDPWKTSQSGATAARIAPGDEIRLKKVGDPTSLGNVTFTLGQEYCVLAAAQTLNVEMCESAWTAATNITCNVNATYRRQGSYSCSYVVGSSFTTGKMAYKSFTSTDFSSYQKLSFQIYSTSNITSGYIKLCLCSDTAGNTIVDNFIIDLAITGGYWHTLTIAKDGGGNLGASIQSVALYAITDPGTPTIYLDSIIACTSTGLCLNSIITKSSSAIDRTNPVYPISAINGVNVYFGISNGLNNSVSIPAKYREATETVTGYFINPLRYSTLGSGFGSATDNTTDSGSSGTYITFKGGWNFTSDLQDGETWFDGLSSTTYTPYSFHSTNIYIALDNINFIRWYGFATTTPSGNKYPASINRMSLLQCTVGAILQHPGGGGSINFQYMNGCAVSIQLNNCHDVTVTGTKILNTRDGIALGGTPYDGLTIQIDEIDGGIVTANHSALTFQSYPCMNILVKDTVIGNFIYAAVIHGFVRMHNVEIKSTCSYGIATYYASKVYMRNCLISSASETVNQYSYRNERVYSLQHDQTIGNNKLFCYGATGEWQTSTKHDTEPGAWKYTISTVTWSSTLPFQEEIAQIAVAADTTYTVTAWVKKDHATNIGASLAVYTDTDVLEIASDSIDTKANDTDWEQLSISFTPSEAGVVPVYINAWYNGATSNIYVGTISVTSA